MARRKKDKNELLKGTAITTGAGFGVKGLERALISHGNLKKDFRSYNEVKNYYSNLRSGDVLFLQETFTGGKTHPMVVTDPKTRFYWPGEKGWKAGIKDPIAIPATKEHQALANVARADQTGRLGNLHIKRILSETGKNPEMASSYWHTPYQGKYFEVLMGGGKGSSPVELGSLEGKLKSMSHVRKKHYTAPGEFTWRQEFSPQASRHLGGIYRAPGISAKKIQAVTQQLAEKAREGKVRYSPFARRFNIKDICTKGSCITAADEVLRQAGANRPRVAYLPNQFLRGLQEIKKARTISSGKINILTPMFLTAGGLTTYKGLEKKDAKKTLAGTAAIGAGVALNLSDPIRNTFNVVGGLVARSVGGMVTEAPSKIYDALSKKKLPLEKTKSFATSMWLERHPKVTSRVGATLLGIPLAYAGYKALSSVTDKGKKIKKGSIEVNNSFYRGFKNEMEKIAKEQKSFVCEA